jgi:ubiquinone/menaquinone biosynthesis C-methylase UbiE/pimeloyl-ACP methyl ester carboxylesterase
MTFVEQISSDQLRRLHPRVIEEPSQIASLLTRLLEEQVTLRQGLNRQIEPETARVVAVTGDHLVLRAAGFERTDQRSLLLNFSLDGQTFSFPTMRLDDEVNGRVRAQKPRAVFCKERRDRARRPPGNGFSDPSRVLLIEEGRLERQAQVENCSAGGLGVRLPVAESRVSPRFRVRFVDGDRAGCEADAELRHQASDSARSGWTRLGLALSNHGSPSPLPVVHRDEVLPGRTLDRVRRRWSALAQGAAYASTRLVRSLSPRKREGPEIRLARYQNERGERLVGIIDSWGDTRGATAVVIAPAWGRTKETLLPLARTIVEAFRADNRPVVVLRFDGIRKRGESHNDPDCLEPGTEHHRFTFSQGVRDISATLDFLESSPELSPSKTILVTFSAASIDGRAAVVRESAGRIAGWVCVVGAPDLQSAMRVISGGVDYVGGVERGVSFGYQEILGVEVEMDFAAKDAIAHKLAFLEDARRDLAQISQPITWFHGEHDAWMDVDRAKDILSRGDTRRRQLVVIPTGHQLQSSRQALEVFQSISLEIGRMALGVELRPELPNFADLDARRGAERSRRPAVETNLRDFWHDYLVGRDGVLGIELMTSASNYQSLMETQIEALRVGAGDVVLDVGAGTGAFPTQIADRGDCPVPLEIVELDFVKDGLHRTRKRLEERVLPKGLSVRYLEANLDAPEGFRCIPLRSESCDRVLASLVLSYVRDPSELLREIHRVLRPGARLVISVMQRDADISKIYMEGVTELQGGLARKRFGAEGVEQVTKSARTFLNDAARLLDLEEQGTFQFWEPDELAALIRGAGFSNLHVCSAFGVPPQAIMVAADRP